MSTSDSIPTVPFSAQTPAIQIAGVSRTFGQVHALEDVSLEIRRGEVLAVLGENGAGKTTLMRILGGLDSPTTGSITRDGQPYEPDSPKQAIRQGISLVHQHFALVPTMTAAEVLLLFRNDRTRRCSRAEAGEQLRRLADDIGFDIDLDRPLGEQSVGEKQRLELLRALDSDPAVLLLDEPTAVLTDDEATTMLDVVKKLAHEQNRAVVLITHRLREVVAAADKVVVLRSGKVVSPVAAIGERIPQELAAEMVGAEVPTVNRTKVDVGAPMLRIEGLSAGKIVDVNLTVHQGEIVGIAGVDGNGQIELELALAGLLDVNAGTVEFDGVSIANQHPRERIASGFAYLPSDRYAQALVGPMQCDENMVLGRTSRRVRSSHKTTSERMASWAVKGEAHHSAESLSGGNAQKLVAARELSETAKFVLACQPARGLDPGAAQQLRQHVTDFAANGGAVLWVSADLDELLDAADVLYVAFSGQLRGPLHPPFARTEIGMTMAGATS